MTSSSGVPLSQALSAQDQGRSASQRFMITHIQGVSRGLKTRLLELGLVEGTVMSAERLGSHLALKVRGDHLLIRVTEGHMINVTPLDHDVHSLEGS